MNIAIEARSLSMKGGVHTYTAELIAHLPRLTGQDAVTVVVDRPLAKNQHVPFPTEVVPLPNALLLPFWMNGSFPRHVRRFKPDVVHFTKAAVPKKKIAPTVVTIHDVIPLFLPQTQSPLRRLWWPRALKRAALMSDHIVTVSEASKRGIVEYLGADPSRITVTPLAVDKSFFRVDIPASETAKTVQTLGITKPYIFFVGTRDKRKNLSALIRAFAALAPTIPHQLVVAGRPADLPDGSEALVRSLSVEDRVQFLEYVSREELPALYRGADVFVWPSIYEGWGFPPQEAMACGVPVIVSDGGSLPEVVGDAGEVVSFSSSTVDARLHDVDFSRRLSERIEKVLSDPSRREQMRLKGLERVANYSWDKVAEKIYTVYKAIA